MRGLALEGGGARGAYHIGVVKALMENGYDFDGFVGTSIGAINAAILAQGDFKKAAELWANISMNEVFDEDEQLLIQPPSLNDIKKDTEIPVNMRKALAKVVSRKGINTKKIKALLETYIDETTIRQSRKDFGLVTVSVNERKPYELMLENIPLNQLIHYLMASACFPGFQYERIGENLFTDGGFHDNCPHRLLTNRQYDEIIVIRTKSLGVFRKVTDEKRIKVIEPRVELGNLLLFSPENSNVNMLLGYKDGQDFIRNLHESLFKKIA